MASWPRIASASLSALWPRGHMTLSLALIVLFLFVGLVAKNGLIYHPGWPQCRSISCDSFSAATTPQVSSSVHGHCRHLVVRLVHSATGCRIFPRRPCQRPVYGSMARRRLAAGLHSQSYGAPVLCTTCHPHRLLLYNLLHHLD